MCGRGSGGWEAPTGMGLEVSRRAYSSVGARSVSWTPLAWRSVSSGHMPSGIGCGGSDSEEWTQVMRSQPSTSSIV